jgi:hypothetical protein
MSHAGNVVEEERVKIFSSAVVEPTDIIRASIKQVLGFALRTRLF